jgi:hypothetical protein
MRASAGNGIPAHSASDVAGVTRFRLVATLATCRLRLRFDRVADDEVAPVNELSLDFFRAPLLDSERLRDVVTVVAVRFAVARRAHLLFLYRQRAVALHEVALMSQECAR